MRGCGVLWAAGVISLLLMAFISGRVLAKSVFAVAGHENGKIKAYLVDPDGEIDFQATIPNPMSDATGLCLWPSKDRIFVTYEGDDTISWASIKKLDRDPVTDNYNTGITSGNGLGGMAVDESTGVLYVISRGTNDLYAFMYDEDENTLVPVALDSPNVYLELEDVSTGIDIAIDEEGSSYLGIPVGRLYVSDLSETVRYFNTATWELEGSITLDRDAAGIGLDTTRGYLYAGYFDGIYGEDYLMRCTIGDDPNDAYIERNMGYSLMDIAVDEDTGYIYLTTLKDHNGRTGAVEVYDPNNWNSSDPNTLVLLDTENDSDFGGQNNGPAGIAVGPQYKWPDRIEVDKDDGIDPSDDPNYVCPDDPNNNTIIYTIIYGPNGYDQTNAVLTDHLDDEVIFVSADPNDGIYDPYDHTYTWGIGDLDANDPNDSVSITVRVQENSEPAGTIVNRVEIESDDYYSQAKEYTPVCCWGGDIIYVDASKRPADPNAVSVEIGVSWQTAYFDLQNALARARGGCGNEIWVANGIYSPGGDSTDSFEIPDGASVYGGFKGDETVRSNRDFIKYRTILTGNDETNEKVVEMGDGALLDGFIVEEAKRQGIYGDGKDFTVSNCVIANNLEYGIYSESGDVSVKWCVIRDNGYDGVRHIGSSYSLSIENCRIYENQQNGIYSRYSIPTVLNSLVYENGLEGAGYYGIKLYQPSNNPVIRNNTIVYNENEGINFTGNYVPDIRNCILWYNNNNEEGGLKQLAGYEAAYYSCVTDPNDLTGTSTQVGPYYNISCDPNFAYDHGEYGYYHLDPGSACIDTGDDTDVGIDELDIDGYDRIDVTYVDMGADEVDCSDVSNEVDWNADGVVNNLEFAMFADAWLRDEATDPNWNDTYFKYDLVEDAVIDPNDLAVFCSEWLWEACWRDSQEDIWMMMAGGGGYGMESTAIGPAVLLAKAVVPEPSLEEQIDTGKELIEWLEEIRQDKEVQEAIDEKQWEEFLEEIYRWLDGLEGLL